MSRWDPARMRVGASSCPTSEKRNSISSARSFDVTFARHPRRSSASVASALKLISMCQPASPGSSGDGNLTGKVPRFIRGSQRPFPTSWSNALYRIAALAARAKGSCPYRPSRMTGFVHVFGSSGSQPVSRQRIARPSSATARGKAPSSFTNPSRTKRSRSASLRTCAVSPLFGITLFIALVSAAVLALGSRSGRAVRCDERPKWLNEKSRTLAYLAVVPGAAPGSPAEEPTNSFFPSVNVMMLPLPRFAPSFAW